MKQLVICLLLISGFISKSQDTWNFPFMEAETLTNKMLNLPEDIQNKYSVIGLAYSKKSEKALKTWFSPAYNTFIKAPNPNDLFGNYYDVNCYFIPMFTGAKRVAYQKTMDNVKKDLDKKLLPHVLFYKGKLKDYQKSLRFDGKDLPYFFVINTEGEIVHSTFGAYSDAKMQEIYDILDEALEE